KINHVGKRYRVEGPHLVTPSPQRTPFLFQAGASEVGRAFSARHAEAAFLPSSLAQAPSDIADLRRRLLENGRDPDREFRFFVLIAPIIG
ncbi:LLM class flavin-dependent oxidoreductase, partial [Acinetobacter baumannii]